MNNLQSEWYEYDTEGDVLDVFFGEKRPAWTIELTEHILLSVDRATEQVVRLTFLDFTELVRWTPFGPRSFHLAGLAALPEAERNMVAKILTSPPVNRWLDLSVVMPLSNPPLTVMHLEPPPLPVVELVAMAA